MKISNYKKIYRYYFYHEWSHVILKSMWKVIVNILAFLLGWHFPKNYITQRKTDMLFGGYEKETALIFKTIIKPGMVVMDVGAHIGYYTRMFSRLVGANGRVYAFEADPENYQLLTQNTKGLNNCKTFPIAVTDHSGTIDFYESVEKSGCHSTVLGAVNLQRKISVPGCDLDTIISKEGEESVAVIKMDIEGGEPLAIKGMIKLLRNSRELILITELSARRLYLAGVSPFEYLQTLSSFGFHFSLIKQEGLCPLNFPAENINELFKLSDPANVFCSR